MIDKRKHAENILSALNLAKAIGENEVEVMEQGLQAMIDAIKNGLTHAVINELNKMFIPIRTYEMGLVYVKNPNFNQFGGIDVPHTQVLKSAAGYYIGDLIEDTFTIDDGTGKTIKMWMPNSRDSECYWETREEAENALVTNKYPVKL